MPYFITVPLNHAPALTTVKRVCLPQRMPRKQLLTRSVSVAFFFVAVIKHPGKGNRGQSATESWSPGSHASGREGWQAGRWLSDYISAQETQGTCEVGTRLLSLKPPPPMYFLQQGSVS